MVDPLKHEIARNFDVFQRRLGEYLDQHYGEYALLRDGQVVAFFPSAGEADGAGWAQFADGLYSIQQITPEPIELGLYANALR
ncbi:MULTISPECIES: hypothetical protein [unclassified Sphingomonas]|jgi:hypothetical protein|uniref:hypothetical protein n=1 Tax=unclassified Sphingomonas TaxID=196159 RepID=UPI000E102755|nr:MULTISPECIES: hypothetical protein [unclassified Sphingomonas]AXJ95253.1 hypothetical protein DM480_06780 [Sphingomonas sp. FARSPH]